jgi:hypothetical protein
MRRTALGAELFATEYKGEKIKEKLNEDLAKSAAQRIVRALREAGYVIIKA